MSEFFYEGPVVIGEYIYLGEMGSDPNVPDRYLDTELRERFGEDGFQETVTTKLRIIIEEI